MRAVTAAALALAVAASVRPATAAPSAEAQALAEGLFREGRRLMSQGRFAEACAKFQASQKLDPSGGTILNLAVCHEREGKTATALVEFNEALAAARRDGRPDREKLARERIAALEPRLAYLTVTVAPEAAALPGLELRRGGVVIGRAAWGVAVPVDPGNHTLSATAPGRKPWDSTVTVVPSQKLEVRVPPLAAEAAAPPSPPPPANTAAAGAAAAPAEVAARPGAGGVRARRLWGLVAGGVAVVSLGIGGYFGVRAIGRNRDSAAHCDNQVCDAEGVSLNSQARHAATVADVGIGVGLAAAAVGAYLIVSSLRRPAGETAAASPQRPEARVAPLVLERGGGIVVGGAW